MMSPSLLVATIVATLLLASPLPSMQSQRKVERVGGDVRAPRPIYKPDPRYTDEAREAKISGSVLVSLVIEADGTTSDIVLKRGLHPGLDENAVAAVKTWKFEPARKNGVPVAVVANIEVHFRLM
ncbi:MAG TPA: energy transducer TonB [Bryobacteraceae bacterium]|nr:energy transducer TonB [Bryobacteraceae bacterium]